MNDEVLRKVQLCQLKILKVVDKICKDNEIKYYIIGGTLLGAIRHKGFIPWDDDLDIAMCREDYNRFTQICKEALPKEYFLQNTENDGLWLFITKIRMNNTAFDDDITLTSKCHNGIYIDIFPLDKIPKNDSIFLEIRYQIMRMMCAVASYKNGKREYKSKVVKCISWLFSWLSFHSINGIALRMVTHYNTLDSEYVTSFMSNYGYKKQRMSYRKVYGDGVPVLFEDDYFTAPSDWDANLKQIFGNYMELPPVEKRGDRHKRYRVVLPDGSEWSNE